MQELNQLIEAAQTGDLDRVRALVANHPQLVSSRDASGATALHHAAGSGHRPIAEFLIQSGADPNARDSEFGATPAGWAIEYLREAGGYLAIELDDLAYAIQRGDMHWVERFLSRFPSMRIGLDRNGVAFAALARECGNSAIRRLFELDGA
jgi:ankyrin repeat protein